MCGETQALEVVTDEVRKVEDGAVERMVDWLVLRVCSGLERLKPGTGAESKLGLIDESLIECACEPLVPAPGPLVTHMVFDKDGCGGTDAPGLTLLTLES
jgi:hypothetical protein